MNRVCEFFKVVIFCSLLWPSMIVASPTRDEQKVVSKKEWKIYIDNSNCRFGDPDDIDPKRFEHALCDAADKTKSYKSAIKQFAKSKHLSLEQASNYAFLLIAATNHDENCKRGICTIKNNTALHKAISQFGLAEPTGNLLNDVGETLSDNQYQKYFINVALKHSEAGTILADPLFRP